MYAKIYSVHYSSARIFPYPHFIALFSALPYKAEIV